VPALEEIETNDDELFEISGEPWLGVLWGVGLRTSLAASIVKKTSSISTSNGAGGRKRKPTANILRRCAKHLSASMKSAL